MNIHPRTSSKELFNPIKNLKHTFSLNYLFEDGSILCALPIVELKRDQVAAKKRVKVENKK